MQKVRVYWNLHKKTWSIQDCKSGLVIDHKQHLSLLDAKFVVRKGGQKRVRQEGKKNVHAFAVGYIMNDDELDFENFTLICDAWNRVDPRHTVVVFSSYLRHTFVIPLSRQCHTFITPA